MKFKQYINELSMKKADWEVKKNNSALFEAVIYTYNKEGEKEPFYFIAEKFKTTEVNISDKLSDLICAEKNNDKLSDLVCAEKECIVDYVWEVSFKDKFGKFDQSKKDKNIALQLFAGLEGLMREFIKSRKPEAFIFTSELGEASRIKLYNLLAKKIERISNFEFYKDTQFGSTYYFFIKK